MQLDALALRMRPRAPLEAADLGVRLCQDAAGSVFRCYGVAYVPVAALALASFEIAAWLPTIVLFCSEPKAISKDYQRYLLTAFRDNLPFSEVPIKLYLRRAHEQEGEKKGGEEKIEVQRRTR